MIYAITVALLSILILGAIVISSFFKRPQKSWEWFIIGLYTYNFFSEITMMALSLNGIRNHALANVHTLIFGIGMLIILSGIWNRMLGKKFPKNLLLFISTGYILVWLLDTFIIHHIHTFNTLCQAVIFVGNLCIVVYLLNVQIFLKKTSLTNKADMFLIIGFLVYCFSNVLIDSFSNYYMNLPDDVHYLVSDMVQMLGAISHLFILLAVIWLAKARKYTLV